MNDLPEFPEEASPIATMPLPSPDTAFIGSEVMSWNGKQLHPFDVMRMSAAYSMGMRYGRWREGDLKEWTESGIYSALPNDIVICLWLCSIEKTARPVKEGDGEKARYVMPFTVPKVFAEPERALNAAYEWAQANNLRFSSEDEIAKGADVFLTIMRQIDASRFTAERKADGKSTTVMGTIPNS